MIDNKLEVWSEKGEHLTHCVYMFLNLGQIVRDAGRHITKQVRYGHIVHCSEMLLELVRADKDFYTVAAHVPLASFDEDC